MSEREPTTRRAPAPAGPQAESVFSVTQIRHLMRVEFSRAQRYGYELGALVLGVDGLDALASAHGFDARDAVLEAVVDLLRTTTRDCDHLGRLVDDRLMAVLPHTGADGSRAVAERLVARARQLEVPVGEDVLRPTLSVGASAMVDGNALFFDGLVAAAEQALGAAREAGGDRAESRAPGGVR